MSGNTTHVADQLNVVRSRMANFAIVHAKRTQHFAIPRHNGGRPGGAQCTLLNNVFKAHPIRMRKYVRDEDRLPEVSSCTAGSDTWTNAHSFGRRPVSVCHVCGHAIPQMQSIFVK